MPDTQFLTTLGMLALLGLAFYFLMWRPSQRKMKEQRERLAAIDVGTRVMLTSGIFGTVRHVGDKQMIIEISPGFEVTVVKQAVMRIADPAEEEFEYEDEPQIGEPTDEQLAQLLQSDAPVDEKTEYPDDPDAEANPNR